MPQHSNLIMAYCVTDHSTDDATREYVETYPEALRYACWRITCLIASLLPFESDTPALPVLREIRTQLRWRTREGYINTIDAWNELQSPSRGAIGLALYVTVEPVVALQHVPEPDLKSLARLPKQVAYE